MPSKILCSTTLAIAGLLAALPLPAEPVAVSPGGVSDFAALASSCPSFDWSGVSDTEPVELAIYRVDQAGDFEPVLIEQLPAGARGWSPGADQCLAAGGRYAWMVRGQSVKGTGNWSEARLFEIAGSPSDEEVRQALETLRRYREGRARDSVDDPSRSERAGGAGDGLTPSGSPDAGLPAPDTSGAGSRRYRLDNETLFAPIVNGTPSQQVVTPPASFSLNLSGDVSLGGAGRVFLDEVPFIHNDKSAGSTASGWEALISATPGVPGATSGIRNTALGHAALTGTTEGSFNTGVGFSALTANTTGLGNTALGSSALQTNQDGQHNTALGFGALLSNVGGYSGALAKGNTAVGSESMLFNTTGSFNTAVGYESLYSSTGSRNTAVGYRALRSNTASNNTAVGARALDANTTGDRNTALGVNAMRDNTEGYRNVAIGHRALEYNTGGDHNVAAGYFALRDNTTGNSNVAIGPGALQDNTEGDTNVTVGGDAMSANTTGFANTAIGWSAGSSWTTGYYNIAVGRGANGVAGEQRTIRIGGNNSQNRAFIEGIRGATTGVADAVPVVIDSDNQLGTISSSARFKEDIHDLGRLSARLADLRPVTFRYKKPFAGGAKPIQFGLIAEEVAEVFPELVVYDEEGHPETVKYHLLSTLLLNEAQRLDEEVTELRRLLAERDRKHEQAIADLERRLDRLAKKKRFRS